MTIQEEPIILKKKFWKALVAMVDSLTFLVVSVGGNIALFASRAAACRT